MAARRNRYKEMKRYMSCALMADAVLFVLFLLFSGLGITWLKVILSIFVIILSCACLVFLFLTQELLRSRSLWMTTAAAAILLCLVLLLILNYPSPNTYKTDADSGNSPAVSLVSENIPY